MPVNLAVRLTIISMPSFSKPTKAEIQAAYGKTVPDIMAFHQPKAVIGRQPDGLHDAILWVLPNPSGLNAHYQVNDLARVYAEMKQFSDC